MSPEQIVEATLFASQTPLTPGELARADEDLTAERVVEAIGALRRRYEEHEHAFQIYQLGDGYQVLTRPEYAPYLERFDSVGRSPALSQAALETLAIIAYRQPLGRVEIEEIRGVDSSTVLRTLQEWELVGVVGRGEGLGRPLLYGTTSRFMDHFGFTGLDDLPEPEDLSVALRPSGEVAEAAGESEEGGEDEPRAGVEESGDEVEEPGAAEEAEAVEEAEEAEDAAEEPEGVREGGEAGEASGGGAAG